DVIPRQTQVQVFVILRAIRPQDIQALPAATHAHEETLTHQQPAGIDQVQPPDRLTGIDEIETRSSRRRPPGRALLPVVFLDKRALLLRLGFPQETGHLVITHPVAVPQVLDAAGCIRDAEGLLNPEADLIRIAKAPRANLLLKLLDLCGGEVSRVAVVMESAEGFQATVARE